MRTLKILEGFGRSYLGEDGEIAKNLTKVVRSSLEKKTNRLLSRLGLLHIGINDGF